MVGGRREQKKQIKVMHIVQGGDSTVNTCDEVGETVQICGLAGTNAISFSRYS